MYNRSIEIRTNERNLLVGILKMNGDKIVLSVQSRGKEDTIDIEIMLLIIETFKEEIYRYLHKVSNDSFK